MPRLDSETLDLLTATIREYAAKQLPEAFLLELDQKDEFPTKVLQDLYDPEQIGLQLSIPEAYGGLGGGAYDIYRLSEVMAGIDLGVATGVLATFLARIRSSSAVRRRRRSTGSPGSPRRAFWWAWRRCWSAAGWID